MKILINKVSAYSLIEVLVAIILFSSVMIVSVSIMTKSIKISINNEIAEVARTMAVRVLELAKKEDAIISECDTGANIKLFKNTYYAVDDINFADPTGNICIRQATLTQLIDSCTVGTGEYNTKVIFPRGENYVEYEENYCIQLFIGDKPSANSKLLSAKVRVVYDDLSDNDILYELNDFIIGEKSINISSAQLCGNGIVDPGEECDDGNTVDSDSCSNSCAKKSICGNGILEIGENCDDGNKVNGDTCPSDCGDCLTFTYSYKNGGEGPWSCNSPYNCVRTYYMIHSFNLNCIPSTATFTGYADNYLCVAINGTSLGPGGYFGKTGCNPNTGLATCTTYDCWYACDFCQVFTFDLKPYLNFNGSNVIYVSAYNHVGPWSIMDSINIK